MFEIVQFIVAGAIARRFAGGGFIGVDKDGVDKIKGRKAYAAGFLALITFFLTNSFLLPLIVIAGFYINEIMGTGKIFEMYWDESKTFESTAYASRRGLLKLLTSSGLATATLNPWVVPIGFLGALDGLWYWLGGQLSKKFPQLGSVTYAELLSGAGFGLIIGLCI